jgi:hypothetical protein
VFEVELLSWKSVKDIAGDGGVIKTVVREGSGWAKPMEADDVSVRWVTPARGRGGGVSVELGVNWVGLTRRLQWRSAERGVGAPGSGADSRSGWMT